MVGKRGMVFTKGRGPEGSPRGPSTHKLVLLNGRVKLNHPYILNILGVFHVI
jgi:hypothetical protein